MNSSRIHQETVSIVVVTHNSGKYVSRCLESVFEAEPFNREIIIVDNASSDGSIDTLKKRFPEIKVVRNQQNLGYARAVNIGIAASAGHLLVFLNPDTIVESDWIKELSDAAKRYPRSAFFQPKIMLLNKPGYLNSAGNMIHVAGFGICRGLGECDGGEFNSEEEVTFASGACTLVRKSALDEIGMCDDLFFMYMDDLDWGWRGRMLGWTSTYVPSSIIHHEWSAGDEAPKNKFFNLELGRLVVLVKNLTFRSILALSPILLICEVAVLANAFLNGWLSEKIRSYVCFLKLLGRILKRRRELMGHRSVDDAVVLGGFVTEMRHPHIGVAGIRLGRICKTLFRFLRILL